MTVLAKLKNGKKIIAFIAKDSNGMYVLGHGRPKQPKALIPCDSYETARRQIKLLIP